MPSLMIPSSPSLRSGAIAVSGTAGSPDVVADTPGWPHGVPRHLSGFRAWNTSSPL
ncbi:hypothetical protein L083_6894 [Actinoplanes sp. N902-109]|nr:hypothetical protein L083_6894 [Actinoplanes sp. N902-109]